MIFVVCWYINVKLQTTTILGMMVTCTDNHVCVAGSCVGNDVVCETTGISASSEHVAKLPKILSNTDVACTVPDDL